MRWRLETQVLARVMGLDAGRRSGRSPIECCCLILLACSSICWTQAADLRLRTVIYSPDEIYRLPARVGYEIDLEFESGEIFTGLGAGDMEGLAFKSQSNHLFIKPRATNVHTNLTVLTNRRVYRFEYATVPMGSDIDAIDALYAMRFVYAVPPPATPASSSDKSSSEEPEHLLAQPQAARMNLNYWYCGSAELQPLSVWDDGVQTHLRFNPRTELPAVFVGNDDGTESLLNFNVLDDVVVVHRIARRFIVRRGRLAGCIVNRAYSGSGDALPLGTTSPRVERKTREVLP